MLIDDGSQMLIAERKQWGEDADESVIYIFRYNFLDDTVTATFYLTDKEFAELMARFNHHDDD